MDGGASTAQGGHGLVTGGEARTLLAGPLGADLLAEAAETGGVVSFVVHPLAPRSLGSDPGGDHAGRLRGLLRPAR